MNRFITREIEGYSITKKSISRSTASAGSYMQLSVVVLDTAYNHAVIAEYRTEDQAYRPRFARRIVVRRQAQERCDELNTSTAGIAA